MDEATILEIAGEFLYALTLLALPSIVASLVVGLLIAIFQTITSIQEQTMTFAPRLIAVGVVAAFSLTWAMQVAMDFTIRMFLTAAEIVR